MELNAILVALEERLIFCGIVYDLTRCGLDHRNRTVDESHDELCLAVAHPAQHNRRDGCLNGNMMSLAYSLFVIVVIDGYIYTSWHVHKTTTTSFLYITLFAYTDMHDQPLPLSRGGWGPPGSACGSGERVTGINVAIAVGERVDGIRQQVALVVDAGQTYFAHDAHSDSVVFRTKRAKPAHRP